MDDTNREEEREGRADDTEREGKKNRGHKQGMRERGGGLKDTNRDRLKDTNREGERIRCC